MAMLMKTMAIQMTMTGQVPFPSETLMLADVMAPITMEPRASTARLLPGDLATGVNGWQVLRWPADRGIAAGRPRQR